MTGKTEPDLKLLLLGLCLLLSLNSIQVACASDTNDAFREEHPATNETIAADSRSALVPLSGADILLAGSTLRLKNLYAKHGYDFDSHDAFLEQAFEDWRKLQQAALDSLQPGQWPKTIPPLVAEYDSIRFNIYGMVHDNKSDESYKSSIKATLQLPGSWFVEEGLASRFAGMQPEPTEMNDFRARSFSNRLSEATGLWFLMLLVQNDPELDFYMQHRNSMPLSERVQLSARRTWKYIGELPAYLMIEESMKRGETPYLEITRDRSALQALFTLGVAKRLELSECNILCGGLHAAQIEYYLHYPQMAPVRIKELANLQVEHYLKDSRDFRLEMLKERVLNDLLPRLLRYAALILLVVLFIRRIKRRTKQRNQPESGVANSL